MDIAIKYEKINLGDDKFVFKPVGVIFGEYDSEERLFLTEYNEICAAIDGESQYEDNYFGGVISVDALLEKYEDLPKDQAIEEYFYESNLYYCIAYFDQVEGKLQAVSIPRQLIEKWINNIKEDVLEESQEEDRDIEVVFNLDGLKDLKNVKSLQELHTKLDEIIEYATKLKQNIANKLGTSEELETQVNKKSNKNLSLQKEISKGITLKELRKNVKDVIKGQDIAVDTVTRTLIVNQKSLNPKHKSHMLIIGPSGTGKTEMVNIISKKLDVPFFKADATAYTKEGYVGKSVYSMFKGLIESANGDIKKAENGILIIDEIDKKLTDDVAGIDVLNSLLKIMDRDVIELGNGNLFDTSNLTIIFMGAFAELYKEKESNKNKFLGFGSREEEKEKSKITITNKDLIKAGMPPEFLGRIPVVTNTEELELEDLVEILYKSKGGAIDEEKEFCKDLGITLKFTSGYIREIASKAQKTKTGARNLRKLVRESLYNAYDEILSGKNIKVLKLTKQTALDPKKYYTE